MKPLSAALRVLLGATLGLVFATWGTPEALHAGAAEASPGATVLLAQADTSDVPAFEGDDEVDEEDEVPIPPNLQDKQTLPDTTGAVPDTLRQALPVAPPALPDTLHMPTGQPPQNVSGRPPGSALPSAPAKPKGSLFGLAPVVVIAAIVVVNVLLIRAVGG